MPEVAVRVEDAVAEEISYKFRERLAFRIVVEAALQNVLHIVGVSCYYSATGSQARNNDCLGRGRREEFRVPVQEPALVLIEGDEAAE